MKVNSCSTETSTKITQNGRKEKKGRREGRRETERKRKEIEVLLVLLEMLQKENI